MRNKLLLILTLAVALVGMIALVSCAKEPVPPTVKPGTNIYVEPLEELVEGTPVVFEVRPTQSGYYSDEDVHAEYVDGQTHETFALPVTKLARGRYQTTMPASDLILSVDLHSVEGEMNFEFLKNVQGHYAQIDVAPIITATIVRGDLTMETNDLVAIQEGDTVTLHFACPDGWEITEVKDTGRYSYLGEVEIEAVADGYRFVLEHYTVIGYTICSTEGYAITLAGDVSLDEGLDYLELDRNHAIEGERTGLRISANGGYEVTKLVYIYDGQEHALSHDTDDHYSFDMPAGDVEIAWETTANQEVSGSVLMFTEGASVDPLAYLVHVTVFYPNGQEVEIDLSLGSIAISANEGVSLRVRFELEEGYECSDLRLDYEGRNWGFRSNCAIDSVIDVTFVVPPRGYTFVLDVFELEYD